MVTTETKPILFAEGWPMFSTAPQAFTCAANLERSASVYLSFVLGANIWLKSANLPERKRSSAFLAVPDGSAACASAREGERQANAQRMRHRTRIGFTLIC